MPLGATIDDGWTAQTAVGPGRSLRVRNRPPAIDWLRAASTRVDVSWRVSWRDRLFHGGPSLETDARMTAFERAVATRIEASGSGRLQVVETVDNVRTWTFYTTAPAELLDMIEFRVNAGEMPRVRMQMVDDPHWLSDAAAREALSLPSMIVVPKPRLVAGDAAVLKDTADRASMQ